MSWEDDLLKDLKAERNKPRDQPRVAMTYHDRALRFKVPKDVMEYICNQAALLKMTPNQWASQFFVETVRRERKKRSGG